MKLNRSQQLGLDIDRHIALDAGAGTGKTTVMSHRYVQHILSYDQRATRLLPPSPRIPIKGLGAIRSPARERVAASDWKGLLPTETVAITFTRKAAAELKGKIRRLIASLRPLSSNFDEDGIHDPRISNQGDIDMLLSLMDDAPISTIDSFLSTIVSPWMGLVCENPASEQIDDEGSILLREESIRTAWRLQRGIDAIEVGMRGDIEKFLESRDRLSIRLGGQAASSTVIRGLLKRSLFVEEAARNLGKKGSNVRAEDLDSLFIDPVSEILDNWYLEFRELVEEWIDAWLGGGGHFVTGADSDEGMTRFRYIQYLCTINSEEQIWRLQWIWLVSHAILSPSNWNKIQCKPLNRATLPRAENWPSGIMSKTANKIMDKDVKDLIVENAERISVPIREMMCTSNGLLLRSIGRASFLLNPVISEPELIPNQYAFPPRLERNIGDLPSNRSMRLTTELELEVMEDLFVVHSGVQDILNHLKSLEGVSDHDDMHRYAEDLLLARCPTICRSWYPAKVIDALDSMGEPWSDNHLSRAIIACGDNSKVHEDLMRRITILRELRRSYRAFIIDEFQDTNPQHFRLLARLWGRRHLKDGELREPAGEWDPTICIVGDMKQSIYRFRQAEVTVMRKAVELIRSINTEEKEMEPRLENLRRANQARDPRPIPGKGDLGTGFVKSKKLLSEDAKREEWVSFDLDDDKTKLAPEYIERRRQGHVEMKTNHRTLPKLMNTMNYIFQDTFARRHQKLPGPWHAESQDLTPARDSNIMPALEWILPTRTMKEEIPSDLEIPIDPFQHGDFSDRELANQLLAKRLVSLISGEGTRVKDSATGLWKEIEHDGAIIKPEDIMILVSSRSRIPSILNALEEHGVPAVADKQGVLLKRPVVQPLMSLLWLACSPNNRSAAFALGQSCIVGLEDSKLNDFLLNSEGNQILNLAEIVSSPQVKSLLEKVNYFVSNNEIIKAINTVIDYSDLLITYPREGDRQDVNNWLSLFERLLEKEGGDAGLAQLRLKELLALEEDGPKSTSDGTTGAVQILTIHSSKGLESPVVLLYDLFNIGLSDSSLSSMDNVLVTPQMIAGRIHPWRGFKKPESGLWSLAYLMDEGQRLAERRRQFYVALTRARDRLILVGSKRGCARESSDGQIEMARGEGRPNMGYMFLDGLAYSSIQAGNEGCCWSIGGLDQTGNILRLNPAELAKESFLPDNCVREILVFHHPDCFNTSKIKSPFTKWKERLEKANKVQSQSTQLKNRIRIHEIGLPSHSLDAAWKCKRSYWLNMRLNWKDETLRHISKNEKKPFWPTAAEFGSLFHRLLEIGLPNPGIQSVGLDPTWVTKQPNLLMDESTYNEVLTQSSFSDTQMIKRVKSRMKHLAKLVNEGALGDLTNGKLFDGMIVEGLRTELPFNFVHQSSHDIVREKWSPTGSNVVSNIRKINTIFDGRADLVLALKDRQGKGWLQVVDAKTKGCLDGYNRESPFEGNPLQIVSDNSFPFAITDAEKEILHNHRLQLSLYCLALEANEKSKPEIERREILPPAILVAASGRLIRLSQEDFIKSKKDLLELISWMGYVSALDDGKAPPECSNPETCNTCSFFKEIVPTEP